MKAQEDYEEKKKKVHEKLSNQLMEYFSEHKDRIELDKKESKKVKKFLKKGDVKSVFKDHDEVLKYFFQFYCKSEHHSIGMDYELDMQTMDFKEFIRFGYQCNIVPTLMPVEDLNHIFHRLVREREDEDPEFGHKNKIDFDWFKRALIRISCIG